MPSVQLLISSVRKELTEVPFFPKSKTDACSEQLKLTVENYDRKERVVQFNCNVM